jgi:hypothetical protein
MKITKQSQLSGKTNTMELDITSEQLVKYDNGELVQNTFPDLSSDEREFLISGITPKEWLDAFGTGEDE